MPDPIHTLLDPASIELNLRGKKKAELIEELVMLLSRSGRINDPEDLVAKVIEREKITSTGIGRGIAIPHALVPTVKETALAFGIHSGARFDAVDNKPVTLFFLLVGAAGSQGEHLRILSRLARYLNDDDFCRTLRQVSSPEEVIRAFEKKEQDSP